mgnify:CR=1 FL=1
MVFQANGEHVSSIGVTGDDMTVLLDVKAGLVEDLYNLQETHQDVINDIVYDAATRVFTIQT